MLLSLSACAAVVGLDDPIPGDPTGGAGSGGATSGGSGAAGAGVGGGVAGAGAGGVAGSGAAGSGAAAGAAGASGGGAAGTAGGGAGGATAGAAGSSGSAGGGVCGNGKTEGTEACDGADLGGVSCTTATGRAATGTLGCRTDCMFDVSNCRYCGDGIKAGVEGCDGADLGGATCAIVVNPGSTGEVSCNQNCTVNIDKCSAPATCGNGALDPLEQCDGAAFGTATCTSAVGKTALGALKCTAKCTLDTSECTYCGDGSINGTEACDGAALGSATCASVTGDPKATGTVVCNASCAFDATGCASCGDGKKNGTEVCDGVDLGGATCASALGAAATGTLSCKQCAFDTTACVSCGNGKKDGTEKCDGTDLGGATCASVVGAGSTGVISCLPSCAFDATKCVAPPSCGNGVKDALDECDGLDLGGATCASLTGKPGATGKPLCTAQCILDASPCAFCGDGVKNAGEVCDSPDFGGATCASQLPGVSGVTGSLSCSADCSAITTTSCSYCGNGRVDGSEACDGADLDGKSCVSLHGPTALGTLSCSPSCTLVGTQCTWCGDGIKTGTEACDVSDFGSATCATVVGAGSTGSLGCTAQCTISQAGCSAPVACGNGNVDAGEQCDGTNLNGATCTSAVGAPATGTLSCLPTCGFNTTQCNWCGNGIKDGTEACDGSDIGGATCQTVAGTGFTGTPTCASCALSATGCGCAAGQTACGTPPSAGCKTLSNDVANCGACGQACSTKNMATVSCGGGTCDGTCAAGYLDCDGNKKTNGCEVNKSSDPLNCGNCGTVCGSNQTCTLGVCVNLPPSCSTAGPGLSDCGPGGAESCCTTLPVTGGTFKRSYDGVTTWNDPGYPATVSKFNLDKYEVTVGRFRKFVAAWTGGWRPAPGAGKHTHLNGGSGLANSAAGGGYEPGWDTTWASNLAPTSGLWDSNLACTAPGATWTSAAGANEKNPVNCLIWFDLAAFCIWDGGFLPSEAEWNYAAHGGSDQRVFPWSSPPTATTVDTTYAVFNTSSTSAVGSRSPKGDGLWGHADLAGNVGEWTLDWYVTPFTSGPCMDCALTTGSTNRTLRGGFYGNAQADGLYAAFRTGGHHLARGSSRGGRCARSP